MKGLGFFIILLITRPGVTAQNEARTSLDYCLQAYPELQKSDVELVYRKKGSAMSATYTWWSVFRSPEKRKYRIHINRKVRKPFTCFQYDLLSTPSQVGVMAHELSHIDFFHSLHFFGFLEFMISQILPGGLKKSERATDIRTIQRGFGEELRSWSRETRENFEGARQNRRWIKYSSRYLTPPEIDSVLQTL